MFEAPDTRRSLVARLQQNHEESWSEFVAIYQPAIYRLARKKGLQHADALDASQEVLSRVHRSIEAWDPDKSKGTFRGWLYRITANTSINVLKKLARHPQAVGDTHVGELLDRVPCSADEDTSLFRAEYRRELFRFVANAVRGEFGEASWSAFWKTGIEGKDAKSVAAELGLSVGAVYTAKCRVLSRIRESAQRLFAEDAQ